ncbi:MAG: hypothetical protein UY21_C0009G0012 [Microgenomates group bacterium GW2011_GWA1_48_10]|nr:MAG: hypothetical protein UY21_C0009G0012 [Microgenomates group bacterium GW2011_GWA1_48_10]
MKLISWNVNGLRSCEEKFLEFVASEQPDVFSLARGTLVKLVGSEFCRTRVALTAARFYSRLVFD